MIGTFLVTVKTGIIRIAAFEFYGNYVKGGVVMDAPGLVIN
jgi:hypothetical protein